MRNTRAPEYGGLFTRVWRVTIPSVALLAASSLVAYGSASAHTVGSPAVRPQASHPRRAAIATNAVLNWADSAEPPTVDSAASTATASEQIGLEIYEDLFALNAHFVPEPMLATGDKVSDHGLVYTIPLRHGVPFQNGQIMTATDVLASLKHWELVNTTGIALSQYVKAMTAVNPYEIRIVLSRPYSPLIYDLTANANIMPAAIAEKAGSAPATTFIGTGPYKLTKWVHGEEIVLTRFAGYKGVNTPPSGLAGAKHAYFKEIIAHFVPSPSVAYYGLRTGEYQLADDLPNLYYTSIQSDPSLKTVLVKPQGWAGLIFNSQEGAFTNLDLRKAAFYAINDRAVLSAAFSPAQFYTLSGTLFFPQQKDSYTTVGTALYNHYDPSLARKYLKKAGYHGQPIVFLETKTYMWMYDADQVIANELSAVGFHVKPLLTTWQAQLAIRPHLNEWNMLETSYSVESANPETELIFSPGYAAKWSNPELTRLLDAYYATTDAKTQLALIGRMQAIFYSQAADVVEGDDNELWGTSKNLTGLAKWDLPVLWNAHF